MCAGPDDCAAACDYMAECAFNACDGNINEQGQQLLATCNPGACQIVTGPACAADNCAEAFAGLGFQAAMFCAEGPGPDPNQNDPCAEGEIFDIEPGQTVEFDNTGFSNAPGASCGSGPANSVVYRLFTDGGTFRIEVIEPRTPAGEELDTIMSLRAPICAEQGAEFACNDDFNGLASGFDAIELPPGVTYIFVHGYNGGRGTAALFVDFAG